MQGYLKTKEGITGSGIRLQDFFLLEQQNNPTLKYFPYHSVLINFYQCQLIFRYLILINSSQLGSFYQD